MTAHLFGPRSSPGWVNFALRTAAEMFVKAGSKAADFIKHNFYVDDGLTSIQSSQEAIKLIQDAQQLYDKGGFHLHKIMSNDKDVLQAIPVHDRPQDVQKLDLGTENLIIECTFGVQWCVQSDSLQFDV